MTRAGLTLASLYPGHSAIMRKAPATLLLSLLPMTAGSTSDETMLTAFDGRKPLSWYPVNDNVMGGRSRGGFEISDGGLRCRLPG